MKRFTKKLIAFLGIFAVLLLTFDLLSATERFRGVFAALTDSSDYEEGGGCVSCKEQNAGQLHEAVGR